MADSTLDSELFYLIDNWPGYPGPISTGDVPPDGFTGASHHNVASAVYPIGTKVQVYNKDSAGEPGQSTFIYLKMGTQNSSVAAAVKTLCSGDSSTNYYIVTNDPDSCVNVEGMPCAIALSAMTNNYYGWFYCGGVVPETWVSGLGGTYATDGTVAAGAGMIVSDASADYMKFGIGGAADAELIAGVALAADA